MDPRDAQRGAVVDVPPPTTPPTYDHPPSKVSRAHSWRLEDAVDGAFFVVGAGLVLWLATLLVLTHLRISVVTVGYLVVFWLLTAYVGLPRLQEVLARIYVPDYFIGRTVTGIGVLGDPVNLALDGSADDVALAMESAGWTRADEVTLRSSWGIIVSSVLRRSYAAAPVSPLFLFGRRQAFAYEREVDGNASRRHHVRFWPVPDHWALPGGGRVDWLAAGTYDRRVGLSLFTLQVTHKIDADVDVERDFVVGSVRYASPQVALRVIRAFSTAFHARNGGGDLVHTDGDLPILDVSPLTAPAPVLTPVPETRTSRLAALHLPPPALLLAGGLSVAKAAVTLVGVLAVLLGVPRARLFPETTPLRLTVEVGSALVILTLWLLVLRRHRWARTLLMLSCTVSSIGQLAALQSADRASVVDVATSSISVLILIAVSSSAARRWVTPRRTPVTTG